ncbi:MAG: HAD-IC family P-type ATPase, partial [Patescibacteria group bacterium]
LSQRLPKTTVFSRVEPLDKQRIVRLLQKQGEVVAMTGDGVNDAVALKSADIGVAMGSGTDIAKDSSDLVLLNNSFATITAAIREGRVIRDNVRRVILFLLSTNAAEVAIFLGSLILGLPLPLLPAQVLWINLVTDGTSDIALSLEHAERDVMRRPPENPAAPLISKILYQHLAFSGIVLTLVTLGLYWYLLRETGAALAYARTMAFSFLAVASLLSVWSFRSLQETIPRRGLTQNVFVPISAGGSMLLHLFAIYVPPLQRFFETVPLSGRDWALILFLGLITTIVIDARKKLFPV